MCGSTHCHFHSSHGNGNGNGNGDGDGDPLTITAFFVRLSSHESASTPTSIPDSLTLLLSAPRSSNSNNNKALEIDGSSTNSPATVSLRRLRLANAHGDVIFGSKQRVRATTQVLTFQLYFREAKLLKGAFKKDDDRHHRHRQRLWKLECCASELHRSISISEAELWVALDGHVAIREKVGNGMNKHVKRSKKHRTIKLELQDIPEETQLDADFDNSDADPEIHLEMDLEGLRRAFDIGIWVLCLGFAMGYMVSKASIANFRPPPTFS